MRACTVCASPQVRDVEAALRAGASNRATAARFGLGRGRRVAATSRLSRSSTARSRKILNPMCDILFDEKIAGSLHLTPGQAYEECDNGNRSAVHWDMVLIQRPEWGGGEVWFDDELVRGIAEVQNEAPVRQGRRYPHYGKTIQRVKWDHCAFVERSDFILASFENRIRQPGIDEQNFSARRCDLESRLAVPSELRIHGNHQIENLWSSKRNAVSRISSSFDIRVSSFYL